jgi:hypothetical protein
MIIRTDYAAKEFDENSIIPYKEFEHLDKLAPDEIEYNGFQG